MAKVLGVECKGNALLFAVARDGKLVVDQVERLETPFVMDADERLGAILDGMSRVLNEVRPELIRILMPEQSYKASYTRLAPRATLETLVRLAALKRGIPVELLARTSARSRLKLPRKGKFEDHVSAAIEGSFGKYWREGRNLAAAAALADN